MRLRASARGGGALLCERDSSLPPLPLPASRCGNAPLLRVLHSCRVCTLLQISGAAPDAKQSTAATDHRLAGRPPSVA
jgi:hypothetical protein